jgi:hypothetical protein
MNSLLFFYYILIVLIAAFFMIFSDFHIKKSLGMKRRLFPDPHFKRYRLFLKYAKNLFKTEKGKNYPKDLFAFFCFIFGDLLFVYSIYFVVFKIIPYVLSESVR